MKTYVKIIYGISLAATLLMLALFYIHETTEEFILSDESEYSTLTDYNFVTYEDKASPAGITQEYSWILRDVPEHNAAIVFYISHQEVEVYADDLLLYRLASGENNLFSDSAGCTWAKAYISPQDEGKEIRILVHPIYQSSIRKNLTIYIGDSYVILSDIIHMNIPVMIISIISILIGIGLITFAITCRKKLTIENNITMLGIFSIFTGVWKLTDMRSSSLLFNRPLVLSTLSLLSLPMMTVSYIFFLRSQFARSRHKVFDWTGIICSFISILTVLLQLTGIADLRETLSLVHAMIIIAALVMLVMLSGEFSQKLSKKLKLTLFCCILCVCGTIVDMCIYDFTGYSTGAVFGILSFLVYTVLMGYLSLKDALYLMKRGKEARHYEQLALHDELTGLYSRIYYSQYVEKHKAHPMHCYLIMFDVNNLKQCNDTFGHAYGDRLLCNSAHIFEQAFMPDGRCIRMGGDEFCVLFRHSTEEEIQNYLTEFDRLVTSFNESHPLEFPIHVAYGYAQFDEKIDSDLNDTLRRADRKMYKIKRQMKKLNS